MSWRSISLFCVAVSSLPGTALANHVVSTTAAAHAGILAAHAPAPVEERVTDGEITEAETQGWSAVDGYDRWMASSATWSGVAVPGAVPDWYTLYAGPWDAEVADFEVSGLSTSMLRASEAIVALEIQSDAPSDWLVASSAMQDTATALRAAAAKIERQLAQDEVYQLMRAAGVIEAADSGVLLHAERITDDLCVPVAELELPVGRGCRRTLAAQDTYTRDYVTFLASGARAAQALGQASARVLEAAEATRAHGVKLSNQRGVSPSEGLVAAR